MTRFPLTLQQQFLCAVDHDDGNGPFGPRYTIVGGWRVYGPLDTAVLRDALFDVITRHESLRTTVVLGEEPYQVVSDPMPGQVTERSLADGDRDTIAEEFVNELEAGTFDRTLPLIKLHVGRFDERDAVVVLDAHHSACDGWSAQVVMRDLAACYDARLRSADGAARRDGVPDLPPVHQLREYVEWQTEHAAGPAVAAARRYWRETLDGAKMLALPTDLPRAEHGPFVTGWHRFVLPASIRQAATALAPKTRSTPYMVLLATYLAYLREQTGRSDLVVPTFTPGRNPAWVQDTVGSFYNFLPLRCDISGCSTLPEIIARVRATCLGAYANELPFLQLAEEAPELMDDIMVPTGACCVFQVVQSPFMMSQERVGGLCWAAMRRRVISAPVGSQLPDGALWTLELHPDGDIVGKIGYTTNVFTEATQVGWLTDYRKVLDHLLLS